MTTCSASAVLALVCITRLCGFDLDDFNARCNLHIDTRIKALTATIQILKEENVKQHKFVNAAIDQIRDEIHYYDELKNEEYLILRLKYLIAKDSKWILKRQEDIAKEEDEEIRSYMQMTMESAARRLLEMRKFLSEKESGGGQS